MDVASFDEIADEFHKRVSRMVWCTVTTIDRAQRPRSRILHPVWEGSTGYIMTGRQSHKAKHIASHPFVSLSYWDPQHQQVHAECRAEWLDTPEDKHRVWKLFETTPEPYGYNPAMFFRSPDNPGFGVLKLTAWRIELWSIGDMASGKPARVWRNTP